MFRGNAPSRHLATRSIAVIWPIAYTYADERAAKPGAAIVAPGFAARCRQCTGMGCDCYLIGAVTAARTGVTPLIAGGGLDAIRVPLGYAY